MSDCNACLYGEPDGTPEFWNVTTPKARKLHKCYECNKEICIGEHYQRVSYKSDGEVTSCCTCLICAEIRKAFYCDIEIIGEFWSQMSDYVFPELTTGCLDRLQTPQAKAYLLARWNEWKFNREN